MLRATARRLFAHFSAATLPQQCRQFASAADAACSSPFCRSAAFCQRQREEDAAQPRSAVAVTSQHFNSGVPLFDGEENEDAARATRTPARHTRCAVFYFASA